jgi:hypothetical protein
MQQQPVQMATPLNKLPLRTTRPDTSDLEDPMIQNVLKEFEDEMVQQQQVHIPTHHQPLQTTPTQNNQPQPYQYQFQQPSQLGAYANQYQQGPKKLINMDLVKKTVIIATIVFLLQNYNIISLLLSRLPEVATKHISGKEFLINFAMIFLIFYSLMYFDLL